MIAHIERNSVRYTRVRRYLDEFEKATGLPLYVDDKVIEAIAAATMYGRDEIEWQEGGREHIKNLGLSLQVVFQESHTQN